MTALLYADVSAMLGERIEQLAEHLTGEQPTFRSRGEIRFYPRGGLVVATAGSRRGVWCHHGGGGVGGDALDLVKHLRKCSLPQARVWSEGWLGLTASDPTLDQPGRPRSEARSDSRPGKWTKEWARRIWSEGVDPTGTLVEVYLSTRGLSLDASAPLRFHPACPRGDKERLPAMLALMTDAATAEPVGTHRTFLADGGKAKAPGQAKMMLGGAGVIRLMDDINVTLGLGVTEGIENALSIMQHAGWRPVWASGSAGGVRTFPVLTGIGALTVFADHDQTGLQAARSCADRWRQAGRESTIRLPPAGKDWNDVALADAV